MMHMATLDGSSPLLTAEDQDARNKRLSAEPASGRLSRMAINGSFFSRGPDWVCLGTLGKLHSFSSESLLEDKIAVETLQIRVLQMKSLMAWIRQNNV